MRLQDYVVPNDIYTFSGDPLDCFKKALEESANMMTSDPGIKFEISYDSQTSTVTLAVDRPNIIETFLELFGPGDVPGYLTEEDMSVIRNLASSLPSEGILVEVGSFLGKSTAEWAKSFQEFEKNYKIVAIDSFNTGIDILRELLSRDDFDVPPSENHIEMFRHYTRQYPSIKPLQAFFNTEFVFEQKVAGVFEDSDHTQRTLNYALPYWWDKIIPGGILCGHDYTMRDVQVSVDAFALLNDLEVHHGGYNSSIWWINKQ
jgi:hypothetical protein